MSGPRRRLSARLSALLAGAAALIGPTTARALPPESPPEPPEADRDDAEAGRPDAQPPPARPPAAREEERGPSIGRPADPAPLAPDSGFYIVRPGETLWSIARRLLGEGHNPAATGPEVARLWELNADRIGSGDPDVLLPGTVLRLR